MFSAGPQRAVAFTCRTARPERNSRPWAVSGHGPIQFFCFSFTDYSFLIVFVQILSKFQIVFSIQIIPTKVCLENSKVTETFL
jgi:hypothetical protein